MMTLIKHLILLILKFLFKVVLIVLLIPAYLLVAMLLPFLLGSVLKGDKIIALQHALIQELMAPAFFKVRCRRNFRIRTTERITIQRIQSSPIGRRVQKNHANKNASSSNKSFDPAAIAKGIFNAITSKDFMSAITLLKAIGNTNNYKLVSEVSAVPHWRELGRLWSTECFALFQKKSQKAETQTVFLKMGLKFNAATGQWSLSGF